jgi:hypothetical protein
VSYLGKEKVNRFDQLENVEDRITFLYSEEAFYPFIQVRKDMKENDFMFLPSQSIVDRDEAVVDGVSDPAAGVPHRLESHFEHEILSHSPLVRPCFKI